MFPIPWNFPFRKKDGTVVNVEDAISGGGGSDLPDYDSSDAGKVLSVDESGNLEWSDEVNSEIQTLTNYANAQNNPNLFDNPWFTVNQRGFSTSVSGGAYGFDRWKGVYSYDSTNKGISFANVADWCQQVFEDSYKEFWDNTIMTMSVKYSDGSISFGTFTYKASGTGWTTIFNDEKLLAQLSATGGIGLTAQAVCSIVAVKLELGSVSTLASDNAPNYATELLKCQRYFYRLKQKEASTAIICFGYCITATDIRYNIPLPVALRSTPTITASDLSKVFAISESVTAHPSALVYVNLIGSSAVISASVTGFTTNTMAYLAINSVNDYIDLSADL